MASTQTSTSAPAQKSVFEEFNGITDGQRLTNHFYSVGGDSYYNPYFTTGSSSVWSRVETNGQWDTMQGTIIEIVWSNRVAFYGTPQGPISASALNERYIVLTNLLATYKTAYYYGKRDDYLGRGSECPGYSCNADMSIWPDPASTLTNSLLTNFAWNPILNYSFSAYLDGFSSNCGFGVQQVIRFSDEHISFKSEGSPFVLRGNANSSVLSMESFWNVYSFNGTYGRSGSPWYALFDTRSGVTSTVFCGIITGFVGGVVSPASDGWFSHFTDWISANATNATFDKSPCDWTMNRKYSDEEENPCYPNPVYPMSNLGDLGCGESWKAAPVLAKYLGGGRYDAIETVPCSAFSILTWDFTYQ
jgi:hypothetical protein